MRDISDLGEHPREPGERYVCGCVWMRDSGCGIRDWITFVIQNQYHPIVISRTLSTPALPPRRDRFRLRYATARHARSQRPRRNVVDQQL